MTTHNTEMLKPSFYSNVISTKEEESNLLPCGPESGSLSLFCVILFSSFYFYQKFFLAVASGIIMRVVVECLTHKTRARALEIKFRRLTIRHIVTKRFTIHHFNIYSSSYKYCFGAICLEIDPQ